MKLTVLGNQGPYPGPGGACSGYLLESQDKKILIDCGSGVLSNLQKVIKIEQIDAIILTHLHSDHMGDMTVFKYTVTISRVRPGEIPLDSIPLYCPQNPLKEFELIDKEAFDVNIINDNKVINIADLTITFCKMPHSYESYAVKIEGEGKTFVYSGDTEDNNSLAEFSKSADLLMSDAGYLNKHDTGGKLYHMTARQNGIIAKEAGVKKLLLTHFWPNDDTNIHLSEAKEIFDNVEVSQILKSYEI